jgi:protein subunit release factor A
LRNLPRIMEGDLDGLIDAIATSERAKQLEASAV